MAAILVPIRHEATQGGFSVVAPRISDSISGALRAGFADAHDMPGDMTDLLAALNKVERSR